ATTLTLNNGASWEITGVSTVTNVAGNEGKLVVTDTKNGVTIDNNSNNSLTVQASEELTTAIENGDTTLQNVAQSIKVETGVTTLNVATAETDIAGSSVLTYNAATKELGAVQNLVNAKNQAISDAGVNLKAHWRAHMNDMNKRMGELRDANGEAGVWTRMVRGEAEFDGAKAQYNQYQVGYDQKTGDWYVGAAVTYAEGDSNYGYGSTDDKSTAFAIYGSKLNQDGSFIDLIARYANVESELDDIHAGTGDYDTDGYSISAEYGKRLQQGNGLWVEPQVELTYGTLDSADFVLSGTGKEVHVGDIDSLIGRVGFRIGKDIKEGNVYARASYLYDFDGETTTNFSKNGKSGDRIKEDLGGGWWEVGVGANINLSKATYIYADVEKTFGGEVDTNWQWNLGVRYSF
ncbi:MAG: autotransporter outer membrane beta-barrel domain-containing protein, partial [Acidaminococcaceae bacterium]|nr:autotransporter outer membrane beta-barrel domain-containing protein [Acidaminococcaceae bacterium]